VLEARADLAFVLRHYDRAEGFYRVLLSARRDDPLPYSKLADIAIARHDYPAALATSQEMLRKFPGNETALLNIARISSWRRDYRTSLDFYDRLLSSVHASSGHYREKARVLGWMGAYGPSLRLYDESLSRYPENSGLRAEAAAKRNFYRNAYRSSVKAYRNWLLAEPGHPEALFDLGQLYFRQKRWRESAATCDRLLAEIPEHRQALAVRRKVTVLSSMTRVEAGFEHFSAKSPERLNDVQYIGLRTAVSLPVQDRLSLLLGYARKEYRFHSGRYTPSSDALTAGLVYRNLPDIEVRAAYTFKQNQGSLEDSHTGYVETLVMPFDNLSLDLAFRREEVIENYETFRSHLQRSRWQGRVAYDGFRRWNAGADYVFDSYSDGNSRTAIGADLTANLFHAPRRLSVGYRWQHYGFSEPNGSYFSPASFTTHTFGVEWQHFLNKEGLFSGADDTYYRVAYRASLEPGSSVSHQIEAGLYRDWSSRLSTSLDYRHTWNSQSGVYEDDLLQAAIRFHF
jgi:tetratricopeptide (TPR) repeat protein